MQPILSQGRTLAALVLTLAATTASAEDRGPFRLDDWLPGERISLRADHRVRYERLWDQFRPIPDRDNDDITVLRTRIHGRVRLFDGLTIGAELQDSRAVEGKNHGFINTTVVNTAELLQAYAELRLDDVVDGELRVRGGRITMDVGKRRFVARNRYRNTANAFNGIDAVWETGDLTLRAFWTLPVQRKPFSVERLRDNDVRFDEESLEFHFWGLFTSARLPWGDGDRGELFLFGLNSTADGNPPRRRRNLYTPGFRVFREARKSRFDYEVEMAFQLGSSRQGTSGPGGLDHWAHFHHVELGYTFDTLGSPRLVVQYDYASGDDDPTDGDNGRFDTLFGARRFDFGPTGIYGPFARSNLNTPGVRLQVRPTETVSAFASFRPFWLAEKKGVWVGGGNVDPNGNSGRYIGSQLELRVRWNLFPKNVRLEGGYAHIFSGEFMEDAPTSPDRGDADYVYTQISIQI